MDKIELLSPAGSKDTFYAAIYAGADSIYMGGKQYNARNSAENFEDNELKELIEFAHLVGVKVYITLNTLVKDKEIKEVLEYANYLYSINADALIVQDLGLLTILNKKIPEFNIHSSTQMTITDFYGIKLLEKYNVKKNILARETPIDRIRNIKKEINGEIEAFIHGALCDSYSGQCYISSYFGGRSGNRGRCAQPCRLAYDIVNNLTDEKINNSSIYPLSMKELKVGSKVKDLIEVGVSVLKIEGRMRKPEYVDRVVRYYRNILDGKTDETLESQVTQVFNRGFTEGFQFDKFGKDMISYDSPKNVGVELGIVKSTTFNSVTILLYENISLGDGLAYGIGSKNNGFNIDNLMINGIKEKEARKGDTIEIKTLHKLTIGEIVYKTFDNNLIKEVKDNINNAEYYSLRLIDFAISIKLGEKICLTATSGKYSIKTYSEDLVAKANKSPVLEEDVIKQLSKTGGTIFKVNNIDIDLENDAFVSKSTFNELRRNAIEEISAEIIKNHREVNDVSSDLIEIVGKTKKATKISLNINEISGFDEMNFESVDLIYIPYYLINEEIAQILKDRKIKTILALRNISKSYDYEFGLEVYNKFKDLFSGVQVDNIDGLAFAKEKNLGEIYCDYELNILNSYSSQFLKDEGVKLFTHSIEANLNEISYITERTLVETECIVYSKLPIMTMKNCPFAVMKNCSDMTKCQNCKVYDEYHLVDRKGQSIYMSRDKGITTLYNPIPLNMLDKTKDIDKTNPDYVRIDVDRTTDINKIISDLKEALITREYVNEGEISRGYYYKDLL